jgi:hypothetical protein
MEALRNNICGRLRAVPPKRNRGRIISPPEQRERPHIAGVLELFEEPSESRADQKGAGGIPTEEHER